MKLVSIAKRVGDAPITDTVSPTKTTVSFSSIPAGGGSPFDVASTARHFPGSDTLRRKAKQQDETTFHETRRPFAVGRNIGAKHNGRFALAVAKMSGRSPWLRGQIDCAI